MPFDAMRRRSAGSWPAHKCWTRSCQPFALLLLPAVDAAAFAAAAALSDSRPARAGALVDWLDSLSAGGRGVCWAAAVHQFAGQQRCCPPPDPSPSNQAGAAVHGNNGRQELAFEQLSQAAGGWEALRELVVRERGRTLEAVPAWARPQSSQHAGGCAGGRHRCQHASGASPRKCGAAPEPGSSWRQPRASCTWEGAAGEGMDPGPHAWQSHLLLSFQSGWFRGLALRAAA
jgi:hypothetical protein